ncbi:MAG: iron permease [Frankiales bacterium]|nr:iron permease [Frankiales bacterium]
MLPTFVIGLREGLEAALIVGILAAFLVQEGRRDALRPMWTGVCIAVAISVAVGAGLQLANNELPEREQEGLETIIAVIAVGFVTWMILWMRRNARSLKGELQDVTASALAKNSAWALVAMAFFAVIREGFETAFFLTAAFNESSNPGTAGAGAALGVALAAVLGFAIYRGGARINLQKFFRATGVVLVFVAAGLVASAFHTAHEVGWISAGQGEAFDLSWLVVPGTVTASLLTGMLGLQPRPVQVEVIGYLVYAVPMLAIVLWPAGARLARRTARATESDQDAAAPGAVAGARTGAV